MTKQQPELEEILSKSSALASEGLHAEQETLLREAINRYSGSSILHVHLAAVTLPDDPGESIQLVNKAVELAPNDAATLAICGNIMIALGRLSEATEYAKKAYRLAGDDFEGWPTLGHLLGQICALKDRPKEAEDFLKLAFKTEPDTAGYGRELATFYYREGRYKEALETVDEALEHLPSDDGLRSLRSEILAQLGIGEGD